MYCEVEGLTNIKNTTFWQAVHLIYFMRPEAHVPRIQNAEIYAGIPVISSDRTLSVSKPWVDKILFFNIIFFSIANIFLLVPGIILSFSRYRWLFSPGKICHGVNLITHLHQWQGTESTELYFHFFILLHWVRKNKVVFRPTANP